MNLETDTDQMIYCATVVFIAGMMASEQRVAAYSDGALIDRALKIAKKLASTEIKHEPKN